MARKFGIIESGVTGAVSAVVINTLTKNIKPEIAEARGADGKVTDRKAYSKITQYDVDGLVDGDGYPQGGEKLAISGKDFMVEDSSETQAGIDFVKFKATLVNKDDAAVQAYS